MNGKNNYNQNMLAVLINNIICEIINYECDHMYIINNDIKKYNNKKHDKKYLKISEKNKIRFGFVSKKKFNTNVSIYTENIGQPKCALGLNKRPLFVDKKMIKMRTKIRIMVEYIVK
ncbi:hypothetical protein [Acanthamoeba polyphaga mimivirus]|uniref:Uncharacterized protein n=1 Tax=Acanthamoeba polyphaga mimivirus TaxID=212035 RepID=A0A2L2DL07_MIMIV|nr:hypothetical protein [Acanthamoeba polyphaga mimivirus]